MKESDVNQKRLIILEIIEALGRNVAARQHSVLFIVLRAENKHRSLVEPGVALL